VAVYFVDMFLEIIIIMGHCSTGFAAAMNYRSEFGFGGGSFHL
jgi:hypothetical protein